MTGTNCDLFTHNQSRSYLNHLVFVSVSVRGGTATRLQVGQLKNPGSLPGRRKRFFRPQSAETGSEAFYSEGTGIYFSGDEGVAA
jgi:hypothetical protein